MQSGTVGHDLDDHTTRLAQIEFIVRRVLGLNKGRIGETYLSQSDQIWVNTVVITKVLCIYLLTLGQVLDTALVPTFSLTLN